MYILSIDLGSTCFKAGIFDSGTRRQIGEHSHYLHYLSRNTKVELAVEEAQTAFSSIIEESLKNAGIKAAQIDKIGVTSQAQTFLLAEKGRHVTPFISWEDSRGKLIHDDIFTDFHRHGSFFKMLPNMQISQLLRLSEAGLINPETELISLPSYFIKKLCGNSVIDRNLAAMTGLYSFKNEDWNRAYLERCGLKKHQLAELVPLGSAAGKTISDIFGLKKGIPVFCCGNDQTAGAAGAKLSGNDMLMTLGTAQVLYQVADTMPDAHEKVVRGPYIHDKFYSLVCAPGGSLISKIIEMDVGIKNYLDFFEKAVNGKTIPSFNIDFDGKIRFEVQSSPTDIAFTTLEHICRLMKEMYENFINIYGEPDRILLAGGGSRNKIWQKTLRNHIDRDFIAIDADPLRGVLEIIESKQNKIRKY